MMAGREGELVDVFLALLAVGRGRRLTPRLLFFLGGGGGGGGGGGFFRLLSRRMIGLAISGFRFSRRICVAKEMFGNVLSEMF